MFNAFRYYYSISALGFHYPSEPHQPNSAPSRSLDRRAKKGALIPDRLPQVVIDGCKQIIYRHRLGEMHVSTGLQGLLFVFEIAPG